MSLVCSVIFIHHAFNANILDKDYAFSDGEILMVDNAVRTHFEPYERHFKEIGFTENTIKKYLQCTNIQTVTVPVPAKFLRASNVPTGLLNEMIAYLNSEERNHHNFSELLLFSCLSIFAACKGFITLLTNGVLSVSGKVRNIVNMKLAHPWKLKDICDCLYISESLLKKKLKQEQTTFSQILLDARMQHAKNFPLISLRKITSELSTIRRGTFMKSALKKSVVSTSISLILASGMAAFAAHAADDVKLKATKTNVAFSDFTPTEYSTKGKPNIIVLTMDDLGYGQLPFDKGSFDPKTMENREVVDTYKIGIDKAIEAAQKSTPTLLSLMDEGVRFTNGYVAHGVSGPSRAAIMTGRAPARFGVYSNTDAQDGIPLTETFLPELFQNHGYYTAAVGKWHLSKISNVPVPEDKQTRDYHDNFTTFSAEEWQPQNRGFDYFMGFHAAGTAYYNSPSLFKNRERVPAKGYISDQLTDEAIGVVDRAKTLDQPFMLYLAYNAPHLPNDNPAPDQYQKQFNTGSQTADNYYASVYSVDQGVKRILEQLKKNGQYDNTIILFTSDNGAVIDGPLPLNGAQKGYKSQTYPGGTHTPMFMWWKGKLQPGNYDKLISAMDFYPTALDAADISIPKDLKLDGVSLLPWLQDKKQGAPHKNLTWITSYSHWFDEENIPFWDNYHKFVRHQSDDYPHNPNTEDLSQFSYTVRNNDYSLVYTVENNQLGLYKLTDLQQKDNLAAANPQVVKEMQGVVREFIDSSQPPLSEVNQEKFNNIKKALSEAK